MPLLKKPKLLNWTRDTTPATLTTVTFSSNNANTALAKVGDIVTLAFVPSEVINSVVVTVSYTMVSGDTTGTVPFTIDFKDINGVSGTQVTATTGSEIVTFDKTLPTLSSAARDTNTQITVTLSELALASTITKANDGGFVVFQTGNPAITYAVSAINPGVTNDKVVLTVADMTVSAAQGGNSNVHRRSQRNSVRRSRKPHGNGWNGCSDSSMVISNL